MNVKHLLALTTLGLSATAVLAQTPTAPLTRAEVVQSVLSARAAGTLVPAGQGNLRSETTHAATSIPRAEARSALLQARASGQMTAAGEGHPGYPTSGDATSTITRSEVLAELQIHREAGLADLDRGEAADPSSANRTSAQAKYARLRESTDFSTRVQRIAAERGEDMTLARR